MATEESSGWTEIIDGTSAVKRTLEALQIQHETLMSELESITKAPDNGAPGSERQFAEYKQEALSDSVGKLQSGLQDAKLLLVLASYLSSLEAERHKLKAQVKRLCQENNWLRQELSQTQQLLQTTEIQLAEIKEEKEHTAFLQTVSKVSPVAAASAVPDRELSPSMDMDNQDETAEANNPSSSTEPGVIGGTSYDVPEKFRKLHQLALQQVHQGKPDVAVPLCKKAVKELEEKNGRNHPEVASMLNILAVLYREQGKLKEATKCLHETLEIREKVFGYNHPAVASTLNNLAVLYGKNMEYKTAEPFCKKALEIRQKLLGPNHPDVAKQFNNLAILSAHLGKYEEVEYYYQRALEIYQMEFGPDDPNVIQTINNLANCYLKQGKYNAAEILFKKVLASVQNSTEATSALTTPGSEGMRGFESSWGATDNSLRTTQGSEDIARGDKTGWVRSAPGQSPTVTSALRSLSHVYREQGQLETANQLDQLTEEEARDKARVAQVLARSDPPPATLTLSRVPSKSSLRPTLPSNIRKLFGLRSGEQKDGSSNPTQDPS